MTAPVRAPRVFGILAAALTSLCVAPAAMAASELTLSMTDTSLVNNQQLVARLVAQPGLPEESTGDLYLGVFLPDGSLFLFDGIYFHAARIGGTLIPSGLVPFRRSITLIPNPLRIPEQVLSAMIVPQLPRGAYLLAMVLVRPGMDPANPANWLSNLATIAFTVEAGTGDGGPIRR